MSKKKKFAYAMGTLAFGYFTATCAVIGTARVLLTPDEQLTKQEKRHADRVVEIHYYLKTLNS